MRRTAHADRIRVRTLNIDPNNVTGAISKRAGCKIVTRLAPRPLRDFRNLLIDDEARKLIYEKVLRPFYAYVRAKWECARCAKMEPERSSRADHRDEVIRSTVNEVEEAE